MNKKLDYSFLLILTIISLSFLSLIFVYSSSAIRAMSIFKKDYFFLKRQIIFYILGFIVLFICSKTNYNIYKKYKNVLLVFSLFLSIIVLISSIGIKVNGSRRWLKLIFFNLNPSEIVKISLIVSLACLMEKSHNKNFKNLEILYPSVLITLMHVLPVGLEDLGSAIQIGIVSFSMIYLSNIDFFYFFSLSILTIPLLSVFILKSVRFKRIIYFLNSFSNNYNHQLKQSLIGIGKGGLLGCNIGNSIQKYSYLPEAHTDFIFSIICEEGGLILGIFILLCYFMILFLGFKISMNSNDLFGKYLALGLTLSITYQALINIAVVIGLIPATGIPLPFISHGGSGVVMNMIFMGILINIYKNGSFN